MFKITTHIQKVVTGVLLGALLFPQVGFAAMPLSDERIRGIIQDGVLWLKNAQEKNGHFRYEYVPYEDVYQADDNIVRQAGAFFQLGEIERFDEGEVYDLEKTLRTSLEYFAARSVEGSFEGQKFRCVKADKEFSCKLGTTALVAVGLMSFLEEYPRYRATYEELLEDYVSYMRAMKKEKAGFRYYYYPSRKSQKDIESSFSNGEAFFALVRYGLYAPRDTQSTVIDETFTYLKDETPFDAPLYLWVMAGLKDAHAASPRSEYVTYAERYTEWRLADNARYRASSKNRCPYIEGLASAESILQDSENVVLRTQVRSTLEDMLTETSWLQIKKENVYRAVVDSTGIHIKKLANLERAEGGFLTGFGADDLTERIDYTQHCLSAYAQTLVDVRGGAL